MNKKGPNAPNPCPVCGRWQNRPVVVDGLVIKENKILLIKRGREPFKGAYAIPGGFVDWDETAKEAVVREIKEETNLDVSVKEFLGYYDSLKRDEKRHTVSLVFICEIKTGSENARAGDDAIEFEWFSLDNLPPLAFDHKKILDDYKRYRERL